MRIVFTDEAVNDLDDLRVYLKDRRLDGYGHVSESLQQRIILASQNPKIGRPAPLAGVRELVDTKYGSLIPYFVEREIFFVLLVYHGTRKPLDYSALALP